MINVAIIGLGRMGITHFSIINSHPKVQIKAVADTSLLILSLFKKYVKNVNVYNDFNDLFSKELLDAVIICTPPSLHYPIAIEAAKRKIHIFVEKPCTIEKNKAQELSDIFEQKKLINQVGYVNRFNDIFKKVKEFIEVEALGEVIRFKSEMYSCTITKSESGNNWRDSRSSGGGATFDMAAHAIDLVNYLFGKPDKITGTSLTKIFSKNVEDAVNATFLYKSGISGILDVNWSEISCRKPSNKIEIFCSHGNIFSNQHGIKIYSARELPKFNLSLGWNSLSITDIFESVPFYVRGNEFTSQIYHFIDCIINNDIKNLCTIKDASKTLDVIEKIFYDFESNGNLKI